MTAPVVHGYPDWGRFASTADKYLVNVTQSFNAGTNTVGPFFVGDQRNLGLFITVATNNCVIQFNFYADSGATQLFSGTSFEFTANDTFEGAIPVLGPWLQVVVFPSASPANVTIQGWGQPGQTQQTTGNARANVLVSDGGTAYAVGNTAIPISGIWPRRAVLQATLPAVVSAVILEAVDAAGVAVYLTEVRGNGISDFRSVYLPAMHMRLTVSNAGPGAQTFRFALTADWLEV